MMTERVKALRRRGFVGPRYEGIPGKLRFAWQELVGRREIVFGMYDSMSAATVPATDGELILIDSFAALAPYAPEIDRAYHAGYTAQWSAPFEWEQQLALLRVGPDIVGFGWVQQGASHGVGCHWGALLPGDYRISRVGVLPQHRRRGHNVTFYRLLTSGLLGRGARRIFVDCFVDNVPSRRAIAAAGYAVVGEIHVTGRLLGQPRVRWVQFGARDAGAAMPATETRRSE